MESLVSYGSDDDQDLEISYNTMGRTRDVCRDRETRDHRRDRGEGEDNYDNVGMDMSDEESNNNSSPHRNDDRRNKNRPGYSRDSYDSSTSRIRERSRSRERDITRYTSKSREESNNRYSRKYDDYNKHKSRTPTKNYDSKSRYDSRQYDTKNKEYSKNNYDRKDLTYDSRSSKDKRKPDRRRSSSKDRRRSNSKEKRRSGSKDRNAYLRKRSRTPPRYKRRSKSRDCKERSKSYDRKEKSKSRDRRDKSKSRERSKSKDNRDKSQSKDHRDRSTSRDRRDRSRSRDRRDRSRSPLRYKGRYDRTSNKLAVLEKLGIEIKTPDSQFITPQMLMQKSITDKIEEVKNATGIELPKYYNPAVMNPSRYAEQIQKRRLLWGNKNKTTTSISETEQTPICTSNEAPSSSTVATAGGGIATIPKVWQQTKFVHDNDGKVASKFKRLMGIKDDVTPKEITNTETLKKQEEMFHSMEAQYEVARAATHTMRGVGLGFGAFTGNFPR